MGHNSEKKGGLSGFVKICIVETFGFSERKAVNCFTWKRGKNGMSSLLFNVLEVAAISGLSLIGDVFTRLFFQQ
jgi:hypothetical protein